MMMKQYQYKQVVNPVKSQQQENLDLILHIIFQNILISIQFKALVYPKNKKFNIMEIF